MECTRNLEGGYSVWNPIPVVGVTHKSINNIVIKEWWDNLIAETKNLTFEFLNDKETQARFPNMGCSKKTAIDVSANLGLSPGSSYLHANKMTDLNQCGKELIAMQFPYFSSSSLFWEKVFESNALILDLTTYNDSFFITIKDGDVYYPQSTGTRDLERGFKIELLGSAENYHTYRVSSENSQKEIRRYHYDQWKDNSHMSLQELIKLVDIIENSPEKSIWVHCLAGVGRTGTLFAAFLLLKKKRAGELGADNLEQTLKEIILDLRSKRNGGMVQTQDQFTMLVRYAEKLINS